MKLLEDLGRQRSSSNVNQSDGLPRDVPKLATKVFQGLRAVYAVSHCGCSLGWCLCRVLTFESCFNVAVENGEHKFSKT